jgi:hypothetical protein
MGPAKVIHNAISSAARPITVAEFTIALLKKWAPKGRGRNTLGQSTLGRCFHLTFILISCKQA